MICKEMKFKEMLLNRLRFQIIFEHFKKPPFLAFNMVRVTKKPNHFSENCVAQIKEISTKIKLKV